MKVELKHWELMPRQAVELRPSVTLAVAAVFIFRTAHFACFELAKGASEGETLWLALTDDGSFCDRKRHRWTVQGERLCADHEFVMTRREPRPGEWTYTPKTNVRRAAAHA